MQASKRVRLVAGDVEATGWTLNVSRGGLRAVLFEQKVVEGKEYQLLWDEDTQARHIKVAWVREEPDGQIVGLQFLDVEGSVPPPDAESDAPPQ